MGGGLKVCSGFQLSLRLTRGFGGVLLAVDSELRTCDYES